MSAAMRAWVRMIGVLLSVLTASAYAAPMLFHDHGHGLAFTPDGKTLLAPSHEGLAIYEDGAWTEIVGPIGGYSAFAVAERAMYSSGHPRPGLPVREPTGLVRSTDGGKSWKPLGPAMGDSRLLAAGYRSGALYVINPQPNAVMPAAGLFASYDEGKTWRHAAARGLEGEVHGLAADPVERATVAAATSRGLYLSRDGGESFQQLERREPVTAVAFDIEGKLLRYAGAVSNQVVEAPLEGRSRRAMRLPKLEADYVTCLAQNPVDGRVIAFATRRRDVYLSSDGGQSWRRIAEARAEEGE